MQYKGVYVEVVSEEDTLSTQPGLIPTCIFQKKGVFWADSAFQVTLVILFFGFVKKRMTGKIVSVALPGTWSQLFWRRLASQASCIWACLQTPQADRGPPGPGRTRRIVHSPSRCHCRVRWPFSWGSWAGVSGCCDPWLKKGSGCPFLNESTTRVWLLMTILTGTSHNTGSRKKQNTISTADFSYFIQLHNNNKWPTCLFLLCSLSTYYSVGRWNSGSPAHDLSYFYHRIQWAILIWFHWAPVSNILHQRMNGFFTTDFCITILRSLNNFFYHWNFVPP